MTGTWPSYCICCCNFFFFRYTVQYHMDAFPAMNAQMIRIRLRIPPMGVLARNEKCERRWEQEQDYQFSIFFTCYVC